MMVTVQEKAKIMLYVMANRRLRVYLMPCQRGRTHNKLRVVFQRNAKWYREFCALYPSSREYKGSKFKTLIKRRETMNALGRIIDGVGGGLYVERILDFMDESVHYTDVETLLEDVPF